jgi:hypothetical protein
MLRGGMGRGITAQTRGAVVPFNIDPGGCQYHTRHQNPRNFRIREINPTLPRKVLTFVQL